jgi:hypothetical protein
MISNLRLRFGEDLLRKESAEVCDLVRGEVTKVNLDEFAEIETRGLSDERIGGFLDQNQMTGDRGRIFPD